MTRKRSSESPPAEAGATLDELADTWGIWLSLRWGFDLRAVDAAVDTLAPDAGGRKTYRRHRKDLLAALEARDDDRIADKLELMHRTVAMARAKSVATTGQKVREPFNKANRERAAAAKARTAEWQARADAKWAEPQHAAKSAQEIARLIARDGEEPDTIRRKIKKLS